MKDARASSQEVVIKEVLDGVEYLNSLPACFHQNPLISLSSFPLVVRNTGFSFQINSRTEVFK